MMWKDSLPKSEQREVVRGVSVFLDITSRCFSAVEAFMHGQRKRVRVAQSLEYPHTDLTSLKMCLECFEEVPMCIKKVTNYFGNVNLSHHLTLLHSLSLTYHGF